MGTRVEHIHAYVSRPPVVLDSDISELRLLLQQYAGVLINRPDEALVRVLEEFLISNHLSSLAEIIAAGRTSPAECGKLLEILLPGDTAFLRPPHIFETFRRDVLPAIAARKNGEGLRPLRLWSVGCSTGEEAYSLGISVCEAFRNSHAAWNVHIVAGDIRRDALKTAERGLYPLSAARQMSRHLVSSYFARLGNHLLVKPRLRNLVSFTCMNVIEPAFIGRFDCIFCLDVLPHLSASGKTALLQRILLAMEPGGYVFFGDQEHPFATEVNLVRQSVAGVTFYQRVLAAAANSGK